MRDDSGSSRVDEVPGEAKVLTPIQGDCVQFLHDNFNVLLLADMGSGKTGILLTAIADWIRLGQIRKAIVVAPIRVCEMTWQAEKDEWEDARHLRMVLLRGSPSQRLAKLREDADVYLVNPELLSWLFDLPKRYWQQFNALIVDESSKFKAPGSRRFRRLRHRLASMTRRVAMTGTPTPNSLMELWSQAFIVDQGDALGDSFSLYKLRFFTPVDQYGHVWKPFKRSKEKIEKLVAHMTFRISEDDDPENAPPKEAPLHIIHVDLPPSARALYDRLEAEYFAKLKKGDITIKNAAVASGKLQQVASGAVYLDDGDWEVVHQEKIKAIRSHCRLINDPMLVSYYFRHELERLRDFPRFEVFGKDTQTIVRRWNQGKIYRLLVHPASIGHGLNMQYGGHRILFFGPIWSQENYTQIIRRLRRRGQTKQVQASIVIARGTVDELTLDVLSSKTKGQKAFLDALSRYQKRRKL